VVTDINLVTAEETVETIKDQGGEAICVQHDVTSEAAWTRVCEATLAEYGGLHILVNNAGVSGAGLPDFEQATLASWREVMNINLDAVFLGTQKAVLLMKDSGGGSIINLSSVAGFDGVSRYGAYCMTKGGVRIFTKAAALELARDNIRVNSVHPGLIQTDMGGEVMSAAARGRLNDNEVRDIMTRSHPIGRLGMPEDIANGVLFLASDDSSFMTGTELVIDGGVTAG